MDLPNESVIIIDSPEKNAKTTKKGDMQMKKNSGFRTPLRTVYESPLTGQISGTCDVIKVTMRNKRNRRSGLTPIARKKRRTVDKSENDNESVIVLSDDEGIQPVSDVPSTSDFIPLVSTKRRSFKRAKSIYPTIPQVKYPTLTGKSHQVLFSKLAQPILRKNPNHKVKGKRRLKGKKRASLRRVSEAKKNSSVENGDDLEIVWASADVSENPQVELRMDQDEVSSTNQTNRKKKQKKNEKARQLREIIVDGCNVANSHGSTGFSEKGLKIVLDYFTDRGHRVKIFLPQHKRCRDRQLIEKWYKQEIVVFTPSRKVGNTQKSITPYDDRFILKYANQCKGIVISSDQFRDLWLEKPEWRETIEERLLAPTFVGDFLMFPEDPLGKSGPTLDDFLSF